MVAGGGQVWFLDLKRNLSHFQDGQWESRALELPGVSWTDQAVGDPYSRAQATASFGWSGRGFGGLMAQIGPE